MYQRVQVRRAVESRNHSSGIFLLDIRPNVWFSLWDDEVRVGEEAGGEEKWVTRERFEHIEVQYD